MEDQAPLALRKRRVSNTREEARSQNIHEDATISPGFVITLEQNGAGNFDSMDQFKMLSVEVSERLRRDIIDRFTEAQKGKFILATSSFPLCSLSLVRTEAQLSCIDGSLRGSLPRLNLDAALAASLPAEGTTVGTIADGSAAVDAGAATGAGAPAGGGSDDVAGGVAAAAGATIAADVDSGVAAPQASVGGVEDDAEQGLRTPTASRSGRSLQGSGHCIGGRGNGSGSFRSPERGQGAGRGGGPGLFSGSGQLSARRLGRRLSLAAADASDFLYCFVCRGAVSMKDWRRAITGHLESCLFPFLFPQEAAGARQLLNNRVIVAPGLQLADRADIRFALAKFFANVPLPFALVGSEDFRDLLLASIKGLGTPPPRLFPSPTTLSKYVAQYAACMRSKLKQKLDTVSVVSITADIVFLVRRSFLGIGVSYLDGLQPRHALLSFIRCTEPKTGQYLRGLLAATLQEFGLNDGRVASFVSDGGSNIVNAMSALATQHGATFTRCALHLMNCGIRDAIFVERASTKQIEVNADSAALARKMMAATHEWRRESIQMSLRQTGAASLPREMNATRWTGFYQMAERIQMLAPRINAILPASRVGVTTFASAETGEISGTLTLVQQPYRFMTELQTMEIPFSIGKVFKSLREMAAFLRLPRDQSPGLAALNRRLLAAAVTTLKHFSSRECRLASYLHSLHQNLVDDEAAEELIKDAAILALEILRCSPMSEEELTTHEVVNGQAPEELDEDDDIDDEAPTNERRLAPTEEIQVTRTADPVPWGEVSIATARRFFNNFRAVCQNKMQVEALAERPAEQGLWRLVQRLAIMRHTEANLESFFSVIGYRLGDRRSMLTDGHVEAIAQANINLLFAELEPVTVEEFSQTPSPTDFEESAESEAWMLKFLMTHGDMPQGLANLARLGIAEAGVPAVQTDAHNEIIARFATIPTKVLARLPLPLLQYVAPDRVETAIAHIRIETERIATSRQRQVSHQAEQAARVQDAELRAHRAEMALSQQAQPRTLFQLATAGSMPQTGGSRR